MYVRSQKSVDATPGAQQQVEPLFICQALGCTLPRKIGQILCPTHWFELPPYLRATVLRAYTEWMEGKTTWLPYQYARLEALIHLGQIHSEDVVALVAHLATIVTPQQSSEGSESYEGTQLSRS
jgi:hypothetical protein